ncbi:MAG: hypothetical protein D3922_01670 [Candidatus Electrothrix sp. AR1]|nr:hypothetical protein [Candidatus Electrothrix sp. AR1]
MKKIKTIAFAGCSVFLLCQCASVDDVRRLNYQLRTMNQKVKDVESNTANQVLKRTAESSSQLDTVAEETRELRTITEENLEALTRMREQDAQKITELEEALQQLRRENQQIRSQSDEIRSESGQVRRENERLIESLEGKINKLSGNIKRLSQARVYAAEKKARQAADRAEKAKRRAVVAAQNRPSEKTTLLPSNRKVRKNYGTVVDAMPQQQTQLRINQPVVNTSSSRRPRITPQRQKMAVSSSSLQQPQRQVQVQQVREIQEIHEIPVQRKPPVSEYPPQIQGADMGDDLLAQGVSQFKAKEYKSAYKVFEQVLAGRPADDQAAKTLYFMGECLFNLGEYDLAILDYQKVISNYSRNPHSSAALLRQGMSFEKLTDHETSKIIYTKLISDYPNSREAGVARQRLEGL